MTSTTSASDNECDICYDEHYDYECPYCHYKICASCFKKVLFNNNSDNQHELMTCVNCHRPLTFGTISKIITPEDFEKLLQVIVNKQLILEKQNDAMATECVKLYKKDYDDTVKAYKIPKELMKALSIFSPEYRFLTDYYYVEDYTLIEIKKSRYNMITQLERRASVLESILKYIRMFVYDKQTNKFNWQFENILTIRTICNKFKRSLPIIIYRPSVLSIGDDKIDKELKLWIDDFYTYEPKTKEVFNDYNDMITYDEFISSISYLRRVEEQKEEITLQEMKDYYNKHNKEVQVEGYCYAFRCEKPDCHGLVDIKTYTCNNCKTKYCSDCFKELTDNKQHICNEEDKLTATRIKSDSRPCPKCAARIYRISGCNQMFCTNCHTGFDWTTGHLILHEFENPHRTEWLEDRQLRDYENNDEFVQDQQVVSYNLEWQRRVYEINTFTNKIINIQSKYEDNNFRYFELRCYYILNIINEKMYNEQVGELAKSTFVMDVLVQIYQNYINNIRNLLIDYVRRLNSFITNTQKAINIDVKQLAIDLNLLERKHINCFKDLDELFKIYGDNYNKIASEWLKTYSENQMIKNIAPEWRNKTYPEIQKIKDNVYSVKIMKEMPRFDEVDDKMEQITNQTRAELINWQITFGNIPIIKPYNPSYVKILYENDDDIYINAVVDVKDFDYVDTVNRI